MEDNGRHVQVLLADDEENVRFAMKETLAPMGCDCREAANGREAVEMFAAGSYDLVVLDYRMPELDGIEALKEIHRVNPDVPVLFVTAYGTKELALEAMREGAYDYFTKPFDVEEMRVVVRRALERRLLRRRLQILSRQMDSSLGFDQIIGSTAEMREIFRLIQKIAGQDVTVLILGESGTGKELVASAIHRHSKRRNGPFVAINCAAIPATLLESELFGHERGAFTGAFAQKVGKFEHAHGGTIFLDEIGDMDALLQAKMLRILQERQFQRVGGNKNVQVDVRIIAATNKDLAQEVAKGNFREDLYFRLNVIPIFLPPLRNRKADVPLLIEHFVRKANAQYGKAISGISREVMERFLAHPWPGNVRELENVISRAVILSHGAQITSTDLPLGFSDLQSGAVEDRAGGAESVRATIELAPEGGGDPRQGLIASVMKQIEAGKSLQDAVEEEIQRVEKDVILASLERNRWRRGLTATFLGISRRNLLRKMQKLGIE
ncbi:MAG: sigma-54-dependent Fis family transcriptional regulator [Candidatus Omnitrophica bacterium]|nr:Regulatory protein AtoC [bacterium]NUN98370.1 sigma-54-dependent Fis family transcriptional regulator [Candidatus Omnitrophota bacterium]